MEAPLYVCKNMPVSAQLLPTKDELPKEHAVDLELCQCSGCGLVQFNCEPVPYFKDSTRAGERSQALIDLRRQQYRMFIEKFNLNGKKILEVGAGKGGFLKTLQEMTEYNAQGYGIENNLQFVEQAKKQYGVRMQQGFLDNPDKQIEGAPFDAFMSFAYPARLTDPNAMLRCVYNNLTDKGAGLIMVPSLEHLCKPGGFYDITSDHIAYYDKNTLAFLLNKNGFDVVESGEAAGLYIYAMVEKKQRLEIKTIWSDVEPTAQAIKDFLNERIQQGKKVACWCAGHFAFTVLSVAEIGPDKMSYIIDNAKFKQGRYAPASHVPIVGPEHFADEPVDTIIILGPMYVDEIVQEIKKKCSPKVSIAVMNKNGIRVIE